MSGCVCVDVRPGTYANQEKRLLPFATPRYPVPGTKPVGIDRCILSEIESLWSKGIETVESCCGHGKPSGYICVVKDQRSRMDALGYQRDRRAPHCHLWPRS